MEFIPANGNNYQKGRQGKTIEFVIIHTVVGTLQSAINAFLNPQRIASAHYIVDYDSPRVVQMVQEGDTAYHAGNFDINLRSIGIEHSDNLKYNDPRPDILYQTSSNLVADICKRYGIPVDRAHIKGHREVSLAGTACPDALDVDRIVAMANDIVHPKPAPAPEWQVKLTPIGSHINKFDKSVDLVNFTTGSVIKTFPADSTVEVHFKTTYNGAEWYLTQFSGERRIPNGFLTTDFDYKIPAPPPPLPPDPIPAPPPPDPLPAPDPIPAPPPVIVPPVEPTPPESDPLGDFILWIWEQIKRIFGIK